MLGLRAGQGRYLEPGSWPQGGALAARSPWGAAPTKPCRSLARSPVVLASTQVTARSASLRLPAGKKLDSSHNGCQGGRAGGWLGPGPLVSASAHPGPHSRTKKYKNKNPQRLDGSMSLGQGAILGGVGGLGPLLLPEIRKKPRLVDCSDVHDDQRDESRQRKRDREESERD
jgi:hypothetical protein